MGETFAPGSVLTILFLREISVYNSKPKMWGEEAVQGLIWQSVFEVAKGGWP